MPLLKTMPGECPAQVLIATTSRRLNRPEPEIAPALTPVEPLPCSGSGGAVFRFSKSDRVESTAPAAFAEGSVRSAPAQRRMAPPFAFHTAYPSTPRITMVMKNFANGGSFMALLVLRVFRCPEVPGHIVF